MPVVKMQKVALLAHKSLQENLLEFLQDQGVMEVSANEDTADVEHPKVAYEKAEVQFAMDFLRPYATKEAQSALKHPGSLEEIRQSALHTDFRSIIDDCKKLEDAEGEVAAEEQRLFSEREQLLPWRGLPMKMDERETETTVVLFGRVKIGTPLHPPAAGYEGQERNVELIAVNKEGGDLLVAAVVWKDDREDFERFAARHGWTEVRLPFVERTPEAELNRMRQALRVIEGRKKELLTKKQKLAESLPDLARLAQYLHWLNDKQTVRSKLVQTDQTMTLTGWIPARQFNDLQAKLEHFSGYRTKNASNEKCLQAEALSVGQASLSKAGINESPTAPVALMTIDPKPDEEPPMQIHNHNAIAPFEAVTRLYGLPQQGEMDPTRPLLPFFILYFGLCLTDAGYGLVLATLMGLMIWVFKLKRQKQKLIWLLFYAGIVTFVVSIPFGGWFGMTPDQAPAFATKMTEEGLRFKGQVWNLSKDVNFFRNLALSLGAIQLLFGIFLSGWWKLIHGKWFDAVAAHFSVHVFVALLALKYLLLPNLTNLTTVANSPNLASLTTLMNLALLCTALLFVWGRGSGRWFIRPIVGVLGAINFCIGTISNILSYLRILALGLATGALAFAINQIALVIKDLLPVFLGIPALILILLVGHMVSIALNGLGSFVHSGRLQFIEFFGQFFQGGGREFNPFRRTVHSIA